MLPKPILRPSRRGGVLKIVLIAVLALLAVALLVVGVFGPAIAAGVARGALVSLSGTRISGDLSVDRVRLSWGGPQVIEGVKLRDPAGELVADVSLRADKGLFGLATGGGAIGDIHVSGDLSVVKTAGGENTLQAAIEPPPSAPHPPAAPGPRPGGPSRLPEALAVRVVIDGLTVTYTDKTAPATGGAPGAPRTVSLPDMKGEASFAVGQPAVVTLSGSGAVDGRPTSVSVNATVRDVTRADGVLTPELASVDATVEAAVPAMLLAALPLQQPAAGVLDEAIAASRGTPEGERATLAVKVAGDARQLDASVLAAAVGADLDLAVRATNLVAQSPGDAPGRVTLLRPGVVRATVTPGMAARLQGADPAATLERPVRAQALLDRLDVPIPAGALDLRGASIGLALTTSDVAGAVMAPGEGGERRAQPFALTPVEARLETEDLSRGARLTASTAAQYAGQNAGELAVDLTASDILDAQGAPRGGLPTLAGTASLRGFATEIAQPFLADAGLVLAEDLGPALDLTLDARTLAAEGDAPARNAIDLRAQAANLQMAGSFEIDERAARTVGEGVWIDVKSATRTLARFLEGQGVRVAGPGGVQVALRDVVVPLGGGGVKPGAVAAIARVQMQPMTIALEGEPTPIELREGLVYATLAPGSAPRVELQRTGGFGADSFEIKGDMELRNLFDAAGDVRPAGVVPVGEVALRNVPVGLAALAGAGKYVELAREALGGPLNVVVTGAPAEGGSALTLDVQAERLRARANATLLPERVEIAGVSANARLEPALVERALAQFAPDLQQRPELGGPTEVALAVEPVTVPLAPGFKPDLERATPIAATLTLDSPLTVRNLATTDAGSVDLGLRGLRATATYALAAAGKREGALEGEVFDPGEPGPTIASLRAGATLEGGRVAQGQLTLRDLDAPRVDAMLGRPGLLDLALGSPVNIDARLTPAGGGTGAGAPLAGTAVIRSPRLSAEASLRVEDDRARLTAPLEAQWTMDPRWASRYLAPAGEGGKPPAFTFEAPVPLTLRVAKATVGLGETPMRPGVFELDARANAAGAEIRTSRGEAVALGAADLSLRSTERPGTIAFNLGLQNVRGAAAGNGGATVGGRVDNLADDQGRLTADAAAITMDAKGEFPSALIDALAQRNGQLAELLGPTVQVDARAANLSRAGGDLAARMTAPRAEATIKGRIEDGLFITDGPADFTLHEITREFSSSIINAGLPLLSELYKEREDGPARVTIAGLRLPIEPEIDTDGDGAPDKVDLRRLNADVNVELGAARYRTADLFSKVLANLKQDTEGRLFRRFPPVNVQIRDGVAAYDKTQFPIGEFSVETRGEIDLAANTMDLIVWVPIGAVANEVVGIFKSVPALDQFTSVPFRMKGEVGKAAPIPAPDILLKDAVKSPEKILEGVGKTLEDLFKRPR